MHISMDIRILKRICWLFPVLIVLKSTRFGIYIFQRILIILYRHLYSGIQDILCHMGWPNCMNWLITYKFELQMQWKTKIMIRIWIVYSAEKPSKCCGNCCNLAQKNWASWRLPSLLSCLLLPVFSERSRLSIIYIAFLEEFISLTKLEMIFD